MRNVVLGVILGAGLLAAGLVVGQPAREAHAGRTSLHGSSSGELITHVSTIDDRQEMLTVIDPSLHALAVYQIDRQRGTVVLRSVRNFHWDLQMLEFNGAAPLPGEIRALLDSR